MTERVPVSATPAIDLAAQGSSDRTLRLERVWRPLTAFTASARSWRLPSVDVLAIAELLNGQPRRGRLLHRGAVPATDDASSQRSSRGVRRARLSGAHRVDDTGSRTRLHATLARSGFHGLMVAVGLTAAVTVWNGASEQLHLVDADSSTVIAVDGNLAETASDVVALADDAENASTPAGTALQPLVHKVVEGDTLRSIAAEFSVSISTILASNKFENPDMISIGQEIVIPPVDGVVADVKSGETLGQLAERYGVSVEDVAQANALASDPDRAVPFERVVVPGKETAERAIGIARRDGSAETAGNTVGSVDLEDTTGPGTLSYEVQEGDTVGQLATQFGVTIWTILTANSLSDPDLIRPGMRLKVLAVNGVEHEIQAGESLADIAEFYKVDLGPLVDFNAIADPENLKVGSRLTIPGAERAQPGFSLAGGGVAAAAPAVAAAPAASAARPANVATTQRTAVQTTLASAKPAAKPQAPVAQAKPAAKPQAPVAQAKPAAKPQAPVAQAKPVTQAAAKPQAPNQLQAAAVSAPTTIASGGGGASVVSAAMRFLGARYVWGGTSPAGFDCSGFVWYVHNSIGKPVSRGLWGQMNGGPRIPLSELQPGDTVFFANTYMPGLSHDGIYIGGGRFIHASDEMTGVKISSLSDSYWGPRYVGASRLY